MTVLFFSCQNQNNALKDLMDKQIMFPNHLLFTVNCTDTIDVDLCSYRYKIILYIDSVGCTSCKMQLRYYTEFINKLPKEVPLFIIVHPRRLQDVYYSIKKDSFSFPLCIDCTDDFNRLNNLPNDDRLRCFLLDSTNRVVLIGNPILNQRIKDLYIKTITERLGTNYSATALTKVDSDNEINLGTFSQSESKSADFVLPNNTKSVIQIDTVFTSCECTTASIDKMIINPDDKATLNVAYTPDGTGDFLREVYVKIRGEDKPKTFIIRGNVK